MICLICRQAETVTALTTVSFKRGELMFALQNVPAQVCSNCGDAYVDDVVAVRLLERAEETFLSGESNDVQEY